MPGINPDTYARFCSACGRPLSAGFDFCPACGSRVVVSTVAGGTNQSGTLSGSESMHDSPEDQPPPPPPADRVVPQDWETENHPPQNRTMFRQPDEPEEEDERYSARSSANSHAGRTFAKVVIAIIVIVILLMVIPLPLPYNATLQSYALDVSRSQLASSSCVSISGSWSTNNGGSVTLGIIDSSGNSVYSADASSGSFSFSASNGPYMVGAYSLLPETVQVSGTCWGPLINVGLP
jgi:hypothetical protein